MYEGYIGKKLSENLTEEYGQKARNLSVMIQNNICVPKGIAISSKMCKKFLNDLSIDFNTCNIIEESLKEKIIEINLDCDVKKEIQQFCNEFPDGQRFSVRSSCLCEDDENYSMAGVFESYVNVDSKSIEDCIKKIYCSLISIKSLEFKRKFQIDSKDWLMGIIIQEYIEGEQSGIMFTADTVHMDDKQIILNYVDSVCCNFVTGSIQSAMVSIEKSTEKESYIVRSNQTKEIEASKINNFIELAAKTEQIFCTHLDIEWTIYKDTLYVLQARPITTFRKKMEAKFKNRNENKIYVKLYDEPVPILLRKIMDIEASGASRGAFESIGQMEFFGELNYCNGYYYGTQRFMDDVTYQHNEERYNLFIEMMTIMGKEIFFDVIEKELQETSKEILNNLFNKEFSCDKENSYNLLMQTVAYIKRSSFLHDSASKSANILLEKFQKTCEKMNLSVEDSFNLVYGRSLLSEMREAIYQMALFIQNEPSIGLLFTQFENDYYLYHELKNRNEAKLLIRQINKYAKKFGVAGKSYDTQLTSVLYEQQEKVIGLIRNELHLLKSGKEYLYHDIEEGGKKVYHKLVSDGTASEDFEKELSLARKAFLAKDNHNYYMEQLPRGMFRLAAINCAKILVQDGMLKKADDIVYLSLEEIKSCLDGNKQIKIDETTYEDAKSNRVDLEIQLNSIMDVQALIQLRKEILNDQKHILYPDVVGNMEEIMPQEAEHEMKENVLSGIAGIRKKVSGKIFIGIPDKIDEDTILVIPDGHIGDIYHLLDKVIGIIFAGGAPYDHIGIVAREMGVATLYYVNDIYNHVKTGDFVELDGLEQKVYLK